MFRLECDVLKDAFMAKSNDLSNRLIEKIADVHRKANIG